MKITTTSKSRGSKKRAENGVVKSARTAENTTVAELLETIAPPREGTTGVHLTSVGQSYLLAIQGPEALHMARLILDFVEALYETSEGKRG
jgi:hypothetical protein